jgi:prepilin-type N-terminal cleavage/methylation domain-containing protein
MKTTRRHRSSGFTLIEVSVATVLIVLVATSAILSLQIGLRTITGTEAAADAAAAIREFREFTIGETRRCSRAASRWPARTISRWTSK